MPFFCYRRPISKIQWECVPTRSAAVSVLLITALFSLQVQAFQVTSSQTAHWFSPERSGEGLVLEVLSSDSALIYWFTYDEEGNQRWLIDVGDIEGNEIVFPALTATHGGQFGPEFDPNDVEQEVVGSAVLRFNECDSAEWSFDAYDQSASYEVVPLTETMSANCYSPNGRPGYPAKSYAGQSGSWYDPAHAGEGYTLHWMSRDQVALIWFSYDTDGNQYWMIGVGTREGDQLVFPSLQTTSGGRFGEQFDSSEVEATEWGSLALDLDCHEGSAEYQSLLPEFASGELTLSRLTFIHDLTCPWTSPALTDLYSFSYEEIPIRAQEESINVRPQNVSNQGEVAALEYVHEGMKVWEWRTGDATLQELPGNQFAVPVLISPDGTGLVAHESVSPPPGELPGRIPMIWSKGEWSVWRGLTESNALIERHSQDGARVVGTANVFVDGEPRSRAWRSDEEGRQKMLPVSEGVRSARGELISNDGRVVIGDQIASDGLGSFRYTSIWRGDQPPMIIRDAFGTPLSYPSGCNSDCSIFAGTLQGGELDASHPNFEQAWLWTETTGVTYLPRIDGAVESVGVPPYNVQDISEDGTMIVGRYLLDVDGSLGSQLFVWTQATGMVAGAEILQAAGADESGWFRMDTISISPSGKYLLISGSHLGPSGAREGGPRAAILTLHSR